MWCIRWICGLIPLLIAGQTTAPTGMVGWMEDYSRGLRAELVDGDISEAMAAYRRVIISRAPALYNQQARYRLANTLRQLGRHDEAKGLLQSLSKELGKNTPLRRYVRQQLDQIQRGDANLFAYWKSELKQAAASRDLTRLKEAADYLALAEGDDGVSLLCEAYERMASNDPGRPVLIRFIGAAERPEVVPLLRLSLSDAEPAVVSEAARALGGLADAASIERLIELLSVQQIEIKRAAALALGWLRSPEAIQPLAALAKNDQDEELRNLAAQALRLIGAAGDSETVSTMPESESSVDDIPADECLFSQWYRMLVRTNVGQQFEFAPDSEEANSLFGQPRIGVVVSAMTHHGPKCKDAVIPYTTQIRKAWALQRGGYDVCLLAEVEAMQDPDAAALPQLFIPPVDMFALGSWPLCDVIIVDQINYLSAAMVRTLAGYCKAGGSLIVCGAVGGGHCGDGVMLRQLLKIRRPHIHSFKSEASQLIVNRDEVDPIGSFLSISYDDWIGPRRGSFFLHDTLGGTILAEYDTPPIWAIRHSRYGNGNVLSFNWDVGLNLQGARDEDELFCRAVDALLAEQKPTTMTHDGGPAVSPLLAMMRHARWDRWDQAKASLDQWTIMDLPSDRRHEAVMQLANIYLKENNLVAGTEVCTKLFGEIGASGLSSILLNHMSHIPRRLRMSLVIGQKFPWWIDVPTWQRLPELTGSDDIRGVPLWLTSPAELPATIRIQLSVPSWKTGEVRVRLKGLELAGSQTQPADHEASRTSQWQVISYRPDQLEDGWFELRVTMQEWDAFACIELDGSGHY